jgi:hypothetical protein
MSKEMWLPSGIVDCDNFKEKDITFDNMANLCYTQRAWANVAGINWSVSNHSYLSAIICAHLLRNKEWVEIDRHRAIVLTLLHDSEEVFVTDIPTPFKSRDIKQIGDNIRNMIFKFFVVESTEYDQKERLNSAVELADILSLFWEVKHGYKHWKDVGIGCIKPRLITRCRRIIYHDIYPSSVKDTFEWVGIDDLISWDEISKGEF